MRYGVGVRARWYPRCHQPFAAGWEVLAFSEPGTLEATGIGEEDTDMGEDPRLLLWDDSLAVRPWMSQVPHVFFFE